IAGPLDRLLHPAKLGMIVDIGPEAQPPLQTRHAPLRMLAAVDPCRPKKDHRVLNVLRPEPSQRFKVLRQKANGTGFFAFEKGGMEIGGRVGLHPRHFAMISASSLTEFSTSLVIVAPPAAVIDAFFNPRALAVWWQATRSFCVPRPLGSYAVEWVTTDFSDD